MYKNEFEKNKRVYPVPYKPTGTQTATPPAVTGTSGGKGPGQDGWESLSGVVEGPVQTTNTDVEVGTRVRCLANTFGMLGYITKPRNSGGFYQVEWDDKKLTKWLLKRNEFEVVVEASESNDMNNEGPMPMQLKNEIASAERRRLNVRRVPKWPDAGMTNSSGVALPPSDSNIFPREVGEDGVVRDKKIHQFGLNEDFEKTSIDNVTEDDMNDWGGMGKELAEALAALPEEDDLNRDDIGSIESEDSKYGPGNYPSEDDYRTEGFYENLFSGQQEKSKDKEFCTWLIPGVLAAGPHPIFTSHLDDLTPLLKAGIKAIVTVHDKPLDFKYLEGTKLSHLFVATVEGSSSDLLRICKFIEMQELYGKPVFIHSFSGKGRAATVLAAYMMYRNWLTGPEDAIAYVRQHYHKDAIETAAQEDALMKFSLDA